MASRDDPWCGKALFFRGFKSVPAVDVALAYSKSVEGAQTGQVYRVV